MPVYSCPKGHQSNESDFCSECGTKIQGSGSNGASAAQASTPAPCPDCGAARADTSSNFCEVCGYNFETGAHGNASVAEAAPPSPAPVADTGAGAAPVRQWTVVVAIDPGLRDPAGPEAPENVPPATVKLEKQVNLIGRRSEKRAINPEVSLDLDDGVSHRHAVVTCGEDGSLTLRDIGSANGTRLNGADVQPLTDIALHDGDQLTLGRWTRLTVRGV
jgi:hypothetical protein